MSSPPNRHPLSPDEVRAALRALGQVRADEAAPSEREFSAELHRRLAAAGAPPALTWLGRLREVFAVSRPVLTGAVLGALVTATIFLLLSTNRVGRDAHTTVDTGAAASDGSLERPVLRPASPKSIHTLGDRRLTRDRLGEDIGAERPERAHVRPEKR